MDICIYMHIYSYVCECMFICKCVHLRICMLLQRFSGVPKDEVNVKGFCPYWTQKQVAQRLAAIELMTMRKKKAITGGGSTVDMVLGKKSDKGESALYSTPSFTFVRNPMSHFVSGLAEAYYRSRNER